MQRFEPNQIIAAVIGRTEDNAISRQAQEFYRLRKVFCGHGRAVGVNQTNGSESDFEQILRRKN